MSLTAYNWARDLKILKSSTLKSLLKELANYENGTGEAWCDVPTFVRHTDLDRKTVIAGMAELVRRGHLVDTGRRSGRTKQIPIYRIIGFDPDFEKTRREEQEQASNSPKIGSLSNNGDGNTAGSAQTTENIEEIFNAGADFQAEREGSQIRDGSENGTVPNLDGKGPVFSGKGSQKRDTNDSQRVLTRDARAPARERARAAPEPEPARGPDLAALSGWWGSRVEFEIVTVGAMLLPGSQPLWPARSDLRAIRGTAAVTARELGEKLKSTYVGREAAGERRNDLDNEMRNRVYEDLCAMRSASAA